MYTISGFSYWLLTILPPFQTITYLGLISIGAMFFIRDFFEGLAYNTSRCALWGGCAVLGIIRLGISALGLGIDSVPPILASGEFHLVAAIISIGIALINIRTLRRQDPGKQEAVMDTYHNWVLLPGYIYLLITIIPLILARGNGRDFFYLIVLVVVFISTFIHDLHADRLDQPEKLRKNGLHFPFK